MTSMPGTLSLVIDWALAASGSSITSPDLLGGESSREDTIMAQTIR